MHEVDYIARFHEALSKAFASNAPDVRAAYFDLANFYRQKLPPGAQLQPTCEVLASCLQRVAA
jgi:hypothetical protein